MNQPENIAHDASVRSLWLFPSPPVKLVISDSGQLLKCGRLRPALLQCDDTHSNISLFNHGFNLPLPFPPAILNFLDFHCNRSPAPAGSCVDSQLFPDLARAHQLGLLLFIDAIAASIYLLIPNAFVMASSSPSSLSTCSSSNALT
ncbi:hypothetical protein MLD38_001454 [Melastoma candidum]|uniref:Uncharacterized protein n=1 Tax=Melastoma candidum TaxID=119954 RepID=A0ACB9SCR8_9MYRT|nr:hypothetical protein MLD38_001454 [Melastoma candidum]